MSDPVRPAEWEESLPLAGTILTTRCVASDGADDGPECVADEAEVDVCASGVSPSGLDSRCLSCGYVRSIWGACDHCLRTAPQEVAALIPSRVAGVQSYNGHLLTGKPAARRVLLCSSCRAAFERANVAGLSVRDDEDAPRPDGA